jgi:hypothetical protein
MPASFPVPFDIPARSDRGRSARARKDAAGTMQRRIYRLVLLRVLAAITALAILGYFSYLIYRVPHLAPPFKYSVLAFIAIVGIAGAWAIVTLEADDPVIESAGERMYSASEVAELLNAMGSTPAPRRRRAAKPAICKYCGKDGAEVRSLDGTLHHPECFQAAYRSGKT